jgi:hypothetical protein
LVLSALVPKPLKAAQILRVIDIKNIEEKVKKTREETTEELEN